MHTEHIATGIAQWRRMNIGASEITGNSTIVQQRTMQQERKHQSSLLLVHRERNPPVTSWVKSTANSNIESVSM